MRNSALKTVIVVAILCLMPAVLSSFHMSILSEILIFGVFALSLNILVGFTGLVSLGHAAFFGVGAYAAGFVAKNLSANFLLTMLAAVLIAVIVSAVIGFFSTRVSGFYFLMLTLAFSQMIYSFVYQWTSVTGGSNGLSGIPSPNLIGSISISNPVSLYFLILAVFLLVYFFVKRLLSSPLGKNFIGIRENETKMKAIGYNTVLYKNLAFIIAGGLGGVAGCLYTYFNGFVSPGDVYWTMSGSVLMMVIIGGSGTIIGPVLGAALIITLETIVSSYTDLSMLIIGVIFIIFVIFAPKGIMGIGESLSKQFKARMTMLSSGVKKSNSVQEVQKGE